MHLDLEFWEDRVMALSEILLSMVEFEGQRILIVCGGIVVSGVWRSLFISNTIQLGVFEILACVCVPFSSCKWQI